MTHRAAQFTAGPLRSYVITIPATATSIGALIKASTAGAAFDLEPVSQVILMEKITAGTDRGAVLVGHHADEMNMYFGAGIPVDPPSRGTDWLVKRVGGTDVVAVAYLGMDL